MQPYKFDDLIGDRVIIASSTLAPPGKPLDARIHGVEPGGIWIESEFLSRIATKDLDQELRAAITIFFVPFSSIDYVISLRKAVGTSR